jgi:hypothetical protein
MAVPKADQRDERHQEDPAAYVKRVNALLA